MYKWLKELLTEYSSNQAIKNICSTFDIDSFSDLQKLSAVLKWIQKNIRYVVYEDGIKGLKPESVERILNTHFTDCIGMTNLLYFILKEMGFAARRCWVYTYHLIYKEKLPSLLVDNHMICSSMWIIRKEVFQVAQI
jgi:hypothetical protein